MSDDDIAKLTLPEIHEVVKRLLDEIELRVMALADDAKIDYSQMPFPAE